MSLKNNQKKFLIIGSNSFSGSHFVKGLLNEGHLVWGISRSQNINKVFLPYLWEEFNKDKLGAISKNFKFKSYNLNSDLNKIIEFIDSIKPVYIINFAAQGMVAESWLNPTHWYKTNVVSQVALHDELRKRDFIKKYIHVTTPEVYGSTDKGWIKENFNFSPSTPYAVSRASCDLHLKSFYEAYNFPVVFTRSANVFGPGQQLYRIIPKTILCALSGEKLNLHGGGISERSFININDVVDATIKICLNAEPGSSWHISTNEVISIKDLVFKICKLLDVEFDSFVNVNEERLGKDKSYLLDSSKTRKKLNWKERFTLDEGLNQTIEWVKSNLLILNKLPWDYIHKS